MISTTGKWRSSRSAILAGACSGAEPSRSRERLGDMSFTSRREFLRASSAVALSAAVPADLFATRREAGATANSVLFVRRRPRGHEVPAARRAQPAAPTRAQLPAAGGGRQRRPRLLGPALAAHVEALRRVGGGREDRRQVRPRRRGARRRQRDRAEARGGSADRSGLRDGFPLDAGVLHPG